MTGDLLGAYATGGLIGSLSAGLLVAAFYDLMPRRRKPPSAEQPTERLTALAPVIDLPRRPAHTTKENPA